MGDQLGVPGEAGHPDHRLRPVVDRRQPPGPRAAHAHAGDADPVPVHLGAGLEVVDEALLVAEHHAPEGAAEQQVELHQALLLADGAGPVEPPGGALARPLAAEVGVDGRDDVAPAGQLRADALAAPGVRQDVLLVAAVPVQADDRRGRALAPFRQEQEAGHDLVHAVVEPEPLQGVAVVLLAGDDLDLRRVRPRRHRAQELDQHLAGRGAVDLLPSLQVGGHGPVGQRHVAERLGDLGPRLALGLTALGRLRPGPDLGRRGRGPRRQDEEHDRDA